ncbi:hypothetical protein EJ04DRAFT_589820 [Polyplosphaeria fusca]|uniref:C2H2-type domain-containing protein n=1 Tax=Polyplosphaeria fusca TaxID=682080 RepID=A0A9P4UUN5_9PLEO|nr:hypothetical protein EJ04DRAFT_589820 [Polyplosphaeria fusca]
MSQSNNPNFTPQFSFSAFFGDQPSQPANDHAFSQWVPQPARTGNNASRQSPAYRQARSPSSSRQGQRMSFNQPIPPQNDSHSRIDPTLGGTLLTIPSPSQLSRPRSALDNTNPIQRFYNEDDPWSSERVRNPHMSFGRSSFSQPNFEYSNYRDRPGSVGESTHRSDSGYYTHPPHSIMSNDPENYDQELPDMTMQIRNISVAPAAGEPTDQFRSTNIDQTSQYSSQSRSKEIKCPVPDCKEVSKCKSDHKKHLLKHHKPFKCNQVNCRRAGKGFTTINDLNRHKKSVHRIGATQNSYQCASETCRNKEKIWPRLDNFKQHISRMHRDEDESELIRKSAYREPEPTPPTEPLSVAPMDTTLAGIGTDDNFPSNESDDHTSGISLTPDQASNPWNSLEIDSTHNFAMDVDETSPRTHDHGRLRRPPASPENRSVHGARSPRLAPPNSERLDALASIAAESSASPNRQAQSLPLSSAPQTKADQQRRADQQKQEALHKFSKLIVQDIQRSSETETVDLESVVLRVLSNVGKLGKKDTSRQGNVQASAQTNSGSNDSDVPSLTKMEAVRATQALTSFIKQTKKPIGVNDRPKPFSTDAKTCEHCNATLARSCDMRKHMKRHTKPYGCTYPKCNKRFGAKSDWKRHENSQHFQLESFRCQFPSPSPTPGKLCGDLFYRAELFKAHLASKHDVDDADVVAQQSRLCRIGKNGQGRFWCGFCKSVVGLTKKRNEAWDERFDHIDAHFNGEKRRIEDWLCVEAKKKKGEVMREMDKSAFEEEGEEEERGGLGEGEGEGAGKVGSEEGKGKSGKGRKRWAESGGDGEGYVEGVKRSKKEVARYCVSFTWSTSSMDSCLTNSPPQCVCNEGPVFRSLVAQCLDCNHEFCSNCPTN